MAVMSKPSPDRREDPYEAAALWYARMSSNLKTPADQEAFDAWVAISPGHAEAYAEACALAGRFDALSNHPELAALRLEAQRVEEKARRPLLARIGGVWSVTAMAAAAAAAGLLYLSS